MQVCSILHVAHVDVRRVIHVIVHSGLKSVEGVLVVVHTFYVAICLSHLFVNCCIRRYFIYTFLRPRCVFVVKTWCNFNESQLPGCRDHWCDRSRQSSHPSQNTEDTSTSLFKQRLAETLRVDAQTPRSDTAVQCS